MNNNPPPPDNNNENNNKKEREEHSNNDTAESHRHEENSNNSNSSNNNENNNHDEEQKAVLRMSGLLPVRDDDDDDDKNGKVRNHENTPTEGEATSAKSSSKTNTIKDKNGKGTTVIIQGTNNNIESKNEVDQTTTKNIKGTKLATHSSVSELPAADVPVRTELRRHGGSTASLPGAYRQAGINHNAGDIARRSVSAGSDTSQEIASGTANQPPLLTATLVPPPPEAPTAPTESTIVAQAELMPEDDEESKESSPTYPAPPPSNRKVIYAIIAIALLACAIVGVVTGLVVSNNASNGSSANSSRNPIAEGNVENESTTGVSATPTSDEPATATPEGSENYDDGDEDQDDDDHDDMVRRVHYLVQWGIGVGGCDQITNPPVDLKCDGGELEFMGYDGTKVECDKQRCFLNSIPDDVPKPGGGSGGEGQRPPSQGGRRQRRYLQGTPTTTFYEAQPEVYLGVVLVACVGTVGDTLVLSAKVSFRDPRRCDFLWMEEETAGGTTVQEAHGGGISSSVTVHAICPPDTESPDNTDQGKHHFEFSPCLKGVRKTLGEANQKETCSTEEPCLELTTPACYISPQDVIGKAEEGNLVQKSCLISRKNIQERPRLWGPNGLWEHVNDYRLRPDDIAAHINTTMDSYVQERLGTP